MAFEIKEMVEDLYDKNNNTACGAMAELVKLSNDSADVYPYVDELFTMLESKKSYQRNRALSIIAANAKWDMEGKIDKNLDKYLALLSDDKAITARECLKGLKIIQKDKPNLERKILEAIFGADFSKYAESMSSLLERDRGELV